MKENFDEILPHLDERRGLMSFTRHLHFIYGNPLKFDLGTENLINVGLIIVNTESIIG